jgi:hypothetical protein
MVLQAAPAASRQLSFTVVPLGSCLLKEPQMNIRVVEGDALDTKADVLVLKYAQKLYGVDQLAVSRLESAGQSMLKLLPKPGGFRLVNGGGQFGVTSILFVGVVTLRAFGYEAIREFARRALTSLAGATPTAASVVFTPHGAGYGLDESEAFRAEFAGVLDAIEGGDYPSALTSVTFIEMNPGRARRLQALLRGLLRATRKNAGKAKRPVETLRVESLRTVGASSERKPHVFVAMPFAPEFDDHYHYGIQQAVNAAGFLCERADLAAFTGDVIAWVKKRIDSARLLVADLSSANPNVYLEVGYAWGKGVPTVLLARDSADLRFDVRGQRCLVYTSIRKLEESLTNELRALNRNGAA